MALNAAQRELKEQALNSIDSIGEAMVTLTDSLRKLESVQLDEIMSAMVESLASTRNLIDAI